MKKKIYQLLFSKLSENASDLYILTIEDYINIYKQILKDSDRFYLVTFKNLLYNGDYNSLLGLRIYTSKKYNISKKVKFKLKLIGYDVSLREECYNLNQIYIISCSSMYNTIINKERKNENEY